MKIPISILLALILSASCLHAQSDTEAAGNVIKLLGFQERYERHLASTVNGMKEGMLQSPLRASIPPSLHKDFDDLIKRTIDQVAQNMRWDLAKEDIVQYFLKTYSREELQMLHQFLESSTGRKFVTGLQTMDKELGAIAQKRLAPLRPQIEKELMEWNKAHKSQIEAYSKELK